MRAVNVGLGANTFLAFMKTGVGILGHSPALLADGINSTSDVAYGIVMWLFMRMSGKPADKEHPYGHDQMETIAAVVVGASGQGTSGPVGPVKSTAQATGQKKEGTPA